MCSKMSYGNRDEDEYSLLCPKKQKHNNSGGGRRRVPRRGPGVAELEKIRLEEQHISRNVQLPLPTTPLDKSPAIIDRTGPVYPFQSYFSTGSFPSDLIPPAPVFHRQHDSSLHYLPPMNLPNQGSGGFYQFIDPTSNQTSCHENVTHQYLDEEKILSAKRPWYLMAEAPNCSLGPTINFSRDAKQLKSLDLRLKNHIQDSGTTNRNPITIDSSSPTISPIPIFANAALDFPRFLQREQANHEIIARRSGANFPVNRKPFYSFLPLNEQCTPDQDRSFSLRSERYDSVTDQGIDLRLKL
ncbi:hypothetical protein CARUB_v10012561mg [Capsella rubella]|uniref:SPOROCYTELESS-like EAR-containing protein 1 n=1 Tax=Capsella rubella TaxID=81985 RepID=R0ILI8_9BRAS|nr:protein SPEAR4 [Capsella rubella]EOA39435.1 hypothetical protein CARUB_v10012561mg [Capsella rubella]QBL95710.1 SPOROCYTELESS-like EAR-containing protein 1 [Capsella rubella]